MTKKIIATYGPSLYGYDNLLKIIKAGSEVIRFNFSHADIEVFDKALEDIKKIKENGYYVETMADLKGNRIRVRNIDTPFNLVNKKKVAISSKDIKSSNKLICLDYPYGLNQIKKGNKIYIDDGNIELECVKEGKEKIETVVRRGGILKNRKGVNIPDVNLYFPKLNEEDIKDMDYIVTKNFDMIALSFVRNSNEISEFKKHLNKFNFKKLPLIVSKIENVWAVKNLNSIIRNSDGVMVARGDLGISLPLYKIPFFQKKIIKIAKKYSKFSIVATQIFESMIEHYRPTRAEISDLANAIEDGCDYIMFSAETAVGRYPLETILTAKAVIKYSTKYLKNGI